MPRFPALDDDNRLPDKFLPEWLTIDTIGEISEELLDALIGGAVTSTNAAALASAASATSAAASAELADQISGRVTDEAMTVVDADSESEFRLQSDARVDDAIDEKVPVIWAPTRFIDGSSIATPAANLQAMVNDFGGQPGVLRVPMLPGVINMGGNFDFKLTAIKGEQIGQPSGKGTVFAFAEEFGMYSSIGSDRSPRHSDFTLRGANGGSPNVPGTQILLDLSNQNHPYLDNVGIEWSKGTGLLCASWTHGCYAGYFNVDVYRNFLGMDFTSRSDAYPDGGDQLRDGVNSHEIHGRVWDNEVGIFIDWGLTHFMIFADVESNNEVGVVWRGVGGLEYFGRGENPQLNLWAQKGSGWYALHGLFSSGLDVRDDNYPSKGMINRPASGTEQRAALAQFSPEQLAVNHLNKWDSVGNGKPDGLAISYNLTGTGGDDGHGINHDLGGTDPEDLYPDGSRKAHFQWDEITGPILPLFYFEADTIPGMPYVTDWAAEIIEGDFALYILDISPVSDPKYLFNYPSNGWLDEGFNAKQLTFVAGQDSPIEELQHVTLTGSPTGGTFTLSRVYDNNPDLTIQNIVTETTTAIAYNAGATAVRTALEGLASVAPGDVEVSGPAGGPWIVRWTGNLRYAAQPPKPSGDASGGDHLTANGAGLTGGTAPGVQMTFEVVPFGGVDDPAAGTRVRCYIRQTHANVDGLGALLPTAGELYIGHHGLHMGSTVSVAPTAKALTEDGDIDIFGPVTFKDEVTFEVTPDLGTAVEDGTRVRDFSYPLLGPAYANTTWQPTNGSPTVAATALFNAYMISNAASAGVNTNSRTVRLPWLLEGGTWTFRFAHHKLSDRGIYTIEVATADGAGAPTGWTTVATGVSGGLLDGYNATQAFGWDEMTGLTIPNKTRFVRFTMPAKNASSSGYRGAISGLFGTRTGA